MRFLTQPYLLTLTPDREMQILWILSERADSYVEFGLTEALGTAIEAQCYEVTGFRMPMADGTYGKDPQEHPPVSVWQYIAKIQNLSPGQTVYYRCRSGGEYTKTYFFHTAPAPGGEYRFAQISDLQALPNCDKTVHQIGCFHPDFILFSGDAAYYSWQIDQWFDMGGDGKKEAFFPCMQQENGARLMQYAPLFFTPGNHEPDDMHCSHGLSIDLEKWNWSICMQLFRPLYPDPDTGINGVRWYSANYGDLHITSLSVNRQIHINSKGQPIFLLLDTIEPGSRQYRWLCKDLETDSSKFKWVIQHFHILNRAWDAQFNLSEPVVDEEENATYPYDRGGMLMDIFSKNKVNAVSYGHSHVYERYFAKGTHYIEAAYLSITFAREGSPLPPTGDVPVFEDNSRRSFAIFERRKGGIFATGYYADEPPIPFDRYQIADEEGNSVAPV